MPAAAIYMPAAAGILIYIGCHGIYFPPSRHGGHNFRDFVLEIFEIFWKKIEIFDRKSGIFIIYMGSRRAIYNDIAASTSVIFRPRQKNSLGQVRALGNFFASDEK